MLYQYTPDGPMPPVDLVGNTWLHDAAMTYVHMRLTIVALDAGEKAVSSKVHGSGWSFDTVGLTDPAWVHGFWTRFPAWNIGLVTGHPSGFLVIDGDVKNGGTPVQMLAAWQNKYGVKIPEGPVVRTPSGGFHKYLKLPADVGHVPTAKGWLPGVDFLADGAQVVAPPSWRNDIELTDEQPLSDSQYEWVDLAGSPYSPTPNEFLAELDDAVAPLELIEDVRTYGSSRTKRPAAVGASGGASTGRVPVAYYLQHGIPEGAIQWEELYRCAWSLQSVGYTREQTFRALRTIADKSPVDPTRGPWRTGNSAHDGGNTLWGSVNRAYGRAERMDGDDYHQHKRQQWIEKRNANLPTWPAIGCTGTTDPKGTAN